MTTLPESKLESPAAGARRAAAAFAAGGLVVFPTETVYGIGAVADNDRGWEALRSFKGRGDTQPFTLHAPSVEALTRYGDFTHPLLQRLVRKLMPGPVTLVLEVDDLQIAAALEAWGGAPALKERLYHHNTIGLRVPDQPLGQAALAAAGGPVVASSANRHGQAPPTDAQQAAEAAGDAAAVVLDGGPCRYARASTILRVRNARAGQTPSVHVERPGVYDERYIRKLLRWTLLLVCSGNTCRSPMAQGLARKVLAEGRGLAAGDLEAAGMHILSAGLHAAGGAPASSTAVAAMARQGIDLSGHRSRGLHAALVDEADVILTMTEWQRQELAAMYPGAAGRTFRLDPAGDIEDPIGAGTDDYVRCAQRIEGALRQRLQEHHP